MSETQAAASTQTAAFDDDWLGYGAYAEALWARAVGALNKDKDGKHALGDDPLVIGIFGEWGAGKSHLLKMVYRLAQDQSKRDIAERVLTASSELPLTITVPVMFQPWKYEHEPHLHVPLAIHVADALDEAWTKLPADFEQLKVWAKDAEKSLAELGEKVAAVEKLAGKLSRFWSGAKKTVMSDAAGVVAGTLDVMAASVGIPPVLSAARQKAKEAMGEADDTEAASDSESKSSSSDKPSKPQDKPSPFSHSTDGLAFYRIHKLMQAMTRPKLDKTLLDAADIKIAKGIEFDLRINFVVFVDDLDRCLPEKAVQTLELIKTMFNIESFAFVLALDDEVIERGIGHRYKEYKLQDKKPEMPITGFEYLEKIVHVPFRLPALSEAEAREFVARYERRVQPLADLCWFQPQPDDVHALILGGDGKLGDSRQVLSGGRAIGASLLDIALSGFDAYMPRKLIRLVELVHQVAHIARLRQTPIVLTPGAGVDARVVLALLLVQLFQPELYRILRRRADSFPVLLAAFSTRPDGQAPELPDARVSDIDLWRWVVEPRPGDGKVLEWNPSPVEQSHSHAVACIARHHSAAESTSARNTAQQVRLPLVVQLVAHRAAHRHVFDVLKLVHRLAQTMAATQSNPQALVFEPYQHFLAQVVKPRVKEETRPVQPTPDSVWESPDQRPRFVLGSVKELVQDLVSADTAAQANLGTRHGLVEGSVLHIESVTAIADELKQRLGGQDASANARARRNLLEGLFYLATFVDPTGGGLLWPLVQDAVDFTRNIDPKLRTLWGDVRASLGCDLRFDKAFPIIMTGRFPGHGTEDEPIPGFVRVLAGRFTMGSDHEGDNPRREVEIPQDFYIQRTLVTVNQFAGFVRAEAYVQDTWWDKQGIEWRKGRFDSQVANENYKKHLVRRGTELRHQPIHWDEQKAYGSRPVWGINWFEARAYCRWLSKQIASRSSKIPVPKGYGVQLPTELQWERAARASSLTQADQRVWPWGDDESLSDQKANLNKTIGSVCPVGLYEANPIGLFDMAGNAWEWMDNLYQPKPDAFERIPKDKELKSVEVLDASDLPTLRGGSWSGSPDYARCSFRDRYLPDGWGGDFGFRVVLSLADQNLGTET